MKNYKAQLKKNMPQLPQEKYWEVLLEDSPEVLCKVFLISITLKHVADSEKEMALEKSKKQLATQSQYRLQQSMTSQTKDRKNRCRQQHMYTHLSLVFQNGNGWKYFTFPMFLFIHNY